MQEAEGKSAFELYTACTAAPIVSCARQIADDPGTGGVSCELPSSEFGVSELGPQCRVGPAALFRKRTCSALMALTAPWLGSCGAPPP